MAAGIASVIALGVAQMMSDQNKEVKALSEKLLTKELELQMKNVFANSDYCNCAFAGKTFDMTPATPVIAAADQFTRLVNGYSAPTPTCTAVGGDFIPTVGTAVPGSTMTIGSIGLGGLTQVSPGVYKADLSVGFNNSIRRMKSIKTNVQFSINMAGGVATARPFNGCGSAAPTFIMSCRSVSNSCAGITCSVDCNANEVATGGGGHCFDSTPGAPPVAYWSRPRPGTQQTQWQVWAWNVPGSVSCTVDAVCCLKN